jgi:hypothetical protein
MVFYEIQQEEQELAEQQAMERAERPHHRMTNL